MVRYFNAVVTVLAETTTTNDEGDLISEYTEIEVIKGDVQPHSLSEDELAVYGINAKKALAKRFFYNGLHQSIKSGNRAMVQSDLDGTTSVYDIMPMNAWPRHGECLLIPVEHEK